MSRVAKSPVVIPAGVEVTLAADKISVKGSGGTLSLAQNVLVKVANNEGKVSFEPANDSREANAILLNCDLSLLSFVTSWATIRWCLASTAVWTL